LPYLRTLAAPPLLLKSLSSSLTSPFLCITSFGSGASIFSPLARVTNHQTLSPNPYPLTLSNRFWSPYPKFFAISVVAQASTFFLSRLMSPAQALWQTGTAPTEASINDYVKSLWDRLDEFAQQDRERAAAFEVFKFLLFLRFLTDGFGQELAARYQYLSTKYQEHCIGSSERQTEIKQYEDSIRTLQICLVCVALPGLEPPHIMWPQASERLPYNRELLIIRDAS
jgi:hypothetical protein